METKELTEQERKAIASLKRLAKKWPTSLWLFSAAGELYVMKYTGSNDRATLHHGGMDDEAIVAEIRGIDNDGGDW